ncbi:MAG: tRNA (adenosine(37)-N6)-dimethylallyltransferase MiaA [Ignavibacteriaceae bacterium]|nr:tRNA (adenosine(37)-N6)-dimethylallyltransferase MiaA [Ignavibacteriaceae bacterium]
MNTLEKNYNLIIILGPTATGKTGLAAKLASKFNGEIISADSRQVYRGMDIGTGKDLADYTIDNVSVPYHLINIIDPDFEYNLFSFLSDFKNCFDDIISRQKIPFLTGGTGLYLNSIIQKYKLKTALDDEVEAEYLTAKKHEELLLIYNKLNPSPHNTTDTSDKQRLIQAILILKSKEEKSIDLTGINPFIIGVNLERDEIKKRITARLKKRLNEGMIEEVQQLVNRGISFDKLDFFGLEYRYLGLYLRGELNYNDMYQKLNSAIHKFAKKQMTWFRKMERNGVEINWINGPDYEAAERLMKSNFLV